MRKRNLGLCPLALLMALAAQAIADDPPPAVATREDKAAARQLEAPPPAYDGSTLADILRIRRELGGVARFYDAHDGSPGDEDEAAFVEELRLANANAAASIAPSAPSQKAWRDAPEARIEPQSAFRHAPGDELIGVLRASARQLDLKAEVFESEGSYRESDRLRKLAQRIRRQARCLAAPHSVTHALER